MSIVSYAGHHAVLENAGGLTSTSSCIFISGTALTSKLYSLVTIKEDPTTGYCMAQVKMFCEAFSPMLLLTAYSK